jgi:hypothetical protein
MYIVKPERVKTKAGLELVVIFSVNYVQDGQEYSQGDSLVLPIV